ncbi:hypothetical protein [Flintibacter sp.]|mgnify:FL=1|uniref:hypothetical protein n=1 Tax=Flintibacter sp. TaxID=1918624 RepID=UPI003A134E0A
MKYRKIYEALERRWQVSPGFRFTDFSGWRNSKGGYTPLWIVAEDKLSGQRVWITQFGRQLSITYKNMDEKGVCYGESRRIFCRDQTHMAQELDTLFARAHQAA